MTENNQMRPSLFREFVRDVKNWGTVVGGSAGMSVVSLLDKAAFAGASVVAKLAVITAWALICGIIWSQRKRRGT